ncbi:MAG TPA: SDR family NAD(P)-dependent oxidoreductase [Aliidongia sp.]|nr:SDR family NAD(P)-dependent oxidoreductase [Aliidongia sp.]
MQFDFKGRKVTVAGGSRGIGRAIALGFAKEGADVSICARGADTLATTRSELASFGGNVHAASCDLGDGPSVVRYIGEAAEALGGIDVLVNNASGFGLADDEAGWAAGFNVDIMAAVRASRTAMPFLEKSGAGASIVNISSISGLRPAARSVPYGAVKAALNHYTTSLAATVARKGIRVNCVTPGSIEFPGGTWEQRKNETPDFYNSVLKGIPFGRMGHPEEIASVVLFLASPMASWVTGQILSVDGGQLLNA